MTTSAQISNKNADQKSNVNVTENNATQRQPQTQRTRFEDFLEGDYICLKRDEPKVLILGTIQHVLHTASVILKPSKFTDEDQQKAQFIARYTNAPDNAKILETTRRQAAQKFAGSDDKHTVYELLKVGEGVKTEIKIRGVR